MTNHPNRSKRVRTVALKIVYGGGVVLVDDRTASDLVIRVSGVPADVPAHRVASQIRRVVLLPVGGPWIVAWERLSDATQGSVLRDCR